MVVVLKKEEWEKVENIESFHQVAIVRVRFE